jgi:hypothetical protein
VLAKAWHRLPAEHRWKLHYLIGADWSRQPYCFVAKRAINEADLLLLRTLLVEQMDRCWGMRLIELFCEDHAPSNTVSARFHSNPLAASILGELPIIRGQPFAP